MTRFIPCLLVLAVSAAPPLVAQIRASERSTISQTIDGTVIAVDYGRPQLRGRVPEPSGVVRVEHMWTPGANWATTVELNRAVRMNGKPVPAGKYSLWIEPAVGTWQVHLNPDPRLFHTQGPPAATMAVSFAVTPVDEGLTEILTFDFPVVSRTTATLRLRWGRATVPIQVEVEPSRPDRVLTAATAAPYIGDYLVQFAGDKGDWSPGETMQVSLFDGLLRVTGTGPDAFVFDLIPMGEPDAFLLGFHGEDGRVQDVEAATPVLFVVQEGRAISWSAQAAGKLESWVRGRRQAPPSTDIWLVRWGGKVGDAVNITNRVGYDNQPSFTPDGRAILYTSSRDGQTDIYRYDIAEKLTRQMTTTAESEYSAIIMPDGLAFAAVRVEADSSQRLWAFALDGQMAVPLLTDTKPVGYHAWADTTTVVLFVLGNPPTLQVADTRSGTTDTMTSQIGRSLQKVPGARAVSFVDKTDSTRWVIRTLVPATGAMTEVAPTRPGREDFAWRAAGSVLMADGAVLHEWNLAQRTWEARQDFRALGLTTITRLAASPDGRWIAVVSDRPVAP